jgi:hypothetical protein
MHDSGSSLLSTMHDTEQPHHYPAVDYPRDQQWYACDWSAIDYPQDGCHGLLLLEPLMIRVSLLLGFDGNSKPADHLQIHLEKALLVVCSGQYRLIRRIVFVQQYSLHLILALYIFSLSDHPIDTMPSSKKGLRVGGASGGFTDRQRSILSLAQCDVDVIVG